MAAAYLLHGDHDIEVFEANDYVGGHTHTIDVCRKDKQYAVDTGFIVFNKVTYPNFCKIMERLEVDSQPTEMTFSVKCERTGLEYSPHTLNTFFIQRKNIFSGTFYRMIFEIFHFRRQISSLSAGDEEIEIGRYLREQVRKVSKALHHTSGIIAVVCRPCQVSGFSSQDICHIL
jgi:predicted NAD/FAD-binding protein